MSKINNLRKVSVFLAVMAVLFIVLTQLVPAWELNTEEWQIGVTLAAGALVACGILTDTSKNPGKLTKESFLQKLKSPVAIGSLISLFGFFIYKYSNPDVAKTMMDMVTVLVSAFTGWNIYNSPNIRNGVREEPTDEAA